MTTAVKVAVIGSGLAGLTTAYLLEKNTANNSNRIETHLFEKAKTLGMDAASITIKTKNGFRVDVPMRSFMSGYYSHLTRLYDHLKIPCVPTKFSFGWYRIEAPGGSPICMPADQVPAHSVNRSYMLYSGSRTVGTLQSPSTSATTFSEYIRDLYGRTWRFLVVAISYLWLMALSLWLHHRGHLRDPKHPVSQLNLDQWFRQHRFHPYFVHEVFIPLFSAVCTNSWQSMLQYPAADVLEYMAMGLFQESYVVAGGVKQVVERLSDPLKHIHLDTEIVSIRPSASPDYRLELQDASGNVYRFHHVVFATQGNQALRLLAGCHDELERALDFESLSPVDRTRYQELKEDIKRDMEMLRTFKYESTVVINHTDVRLLPQDRRHWRSLNFAAVDAATVQPIKTRFTSVPEPHGSTMTTHILNLTHELSNDDDKSSQVYYLQTTHPVIAPDPSSILSVSWFERATVTLESKSRIQMDLFVPVKDNTVRLGPCQGRNGLWFVGSYCWPGIPLLEGCVASASTVVSLGLAAAEGLDIEIPW